MGGRPSCNRICETIKSNKKRLGNGDFAYTPNTKRCNGCSKYIVVPVDAINCPCCNGKLRHHPRNSVIKRKRIRKYIE